jgi:DNA-binding NtrC family response regulator/nitrogen-specific signal transduction histidine kinase
VVKEKMQENLSGSDRKTKGLEAPARKAKDFFEIFYTISHELRTPLTLSIGPLEELLRGDYGKIGRGVQDQIGLALRNNRRLLKMVNHLLVFARLEAGGEHVYTTRRDINQFLSGIVDAFTFLAAKKNIRLTVAGKMYTPVAMDAVKLERALFNIIGNAFKFTPMGGSITIAVEKDTRQGNGDYINISVKDTGIGIHGKDLPHIFERFKQVDSRYFKKYEGTGLGLSLAKELIELQGGIVKVESTYGKGSTFTICLPMAKGSLQERFHNREYRDDMIVSQSEIELADLGYEGGKIREERPTGERQLILFIDDNLDVRKYVTGILKKDYDVITAENGLKGLLKLKRYVPDVIISDIMMPRMDGYQFCKTVKANPALRHIPLIFLTAKADAGCKIASLEEGADDYIVKPFNGQELLARIKSLLRIQALVKETAVKGKEIVHLKQIIHKQYHYHAIIGRSKSMRELYKLLENMKDTQSPVLITGETGTGKELVAHTIHSTSKRHSHPFIVLDCSVLNKNLLESELFGHVKGAFTGALTDKRGIFDLAEGSTLFLDEIGEMRLDTQVKLLRVLEEGTFRPVGSTEERKVSVRIIAATHRDLKKMIAQGKFRQDLYYRINVLTLSLPALRERKEDIPLLVEHFIKKLNGKNGSARSLSGEGLDCLIKYNYPGNVRELKNLIERVFMLCDNDVISSKDLPMEVTRETEGHHLLSSDNWHGCTLSAIIKRTEMQVIGEALKHVKGNKLKAAQLLNISRSTLYAKIEEYHLT